MAGEAEEGIGKDSIGGGAEGEGISGERKGGPGEEREKREGAKKALAVAEGACIVEGAPQV